MPARPEADGYTFDVVTDPADWRVYHDIRRVELFTRHGPAVAYDENYPDEFLPNHFPLLLKFDGVGIGTTRLDVVAPGTGIVRLVAITGAEQGKGHGRVLGERTEAFARARGVSKLLVNAAPGALGYYRRMGFVEESWDPSDLVGIAADCVQMAKVLG